MGPGVSPLASDAWNAARLRGVGRSPADGFVTRKNASREVIG